MASRGLRSTMNSGIYAIICRVNGKKYYGSTRNFPKRKREHWCTLRRNYHRNIHLQRAWNKYGESAFDFIIVQRVPVARLSEVEDTYLPFGDYNIYREADRPNAAPSVEKKCEICGKDFSVWQCEAHRRFCSRECYLIFHEGERLHRTCNRCGKEFVIEQHRLSDGRVGEFCSRECYKPPVDVTEYKCQQCGKTFSKRPRKARPHKYCSIDCRRKAEYTLVHKQCPTCGSMFKPRKQSQKCCSLKCRDEHRTRTYLAAFHMTPKPN